MPVPTRATLVETFPQDTSHSKSSSGKQIRTKQSLESPICAPAKVHSTFNGLVSNFRFCFLVIPLANKTLARIIMRINIVVRNALPKINSVQVASTQQKYSRLHQASSAILGLHLFHSQRTQHTWPPNQWLLILYPQGTCDQWTYSPGQ